MAKVHEMTKKMAVELEKKNQRMLELKAEGTGAVKTA
jgi:hypothetical protein